MYMTNEEIVRDYRQARSPKKHIKVLAELNSTTPDKIQAVLVEEGVEGIRPVKKAKKRERRVNWDRERARELLAEGKSIRKIAKEVGTSYSAVWEWRKRNGLQGVDGRKKRSETERI